MTNVALLVTVDDDRECSGQIGLRIDGIEFGGLNQRGDDCPVLCPGVVFCEECVLAIDGDQPNSLLDAAIVDLNGAVRGAKQVLKLRRMRMQ